MAEGRGELSSDYVVLIPFYSNVGYLRETLQSVVAQTDRRWRAIVVDDSPSDVGVADVVASFGDDRIEARRNERNLGVAGSFNRCFEIAVERRADLAMILHADDVLEPDYIATVRRAHDGSPDAACVATKVTVVGADGRRRRSLADAVKRAMWPRRVGRLEGERGLALLLRGQFFYCPGVSYRLAAVPLPAWNVRWEQVMDLELYGTILLGGGSIALEPRRVFRYRRHAQSMTQVNTATLLRTREETDVCRELAARAQDQGWVRAARAGRRRFSVRAQALVQAVGLAAARRWRESMACLAMSASR
ncbi:MAG: glycosyltransferase family 2 protein [Actinobacteria bacterium]|nr:glycosyltransferase family 2 protein [Actinomycetota bacterium]